MVVRAPAGLAERRIATWRDVPTLEHSEAEVEFQTNVNAFGKEKEQLIAIRAKL